MPDDVQLVWGHEIALTDAPKHQVAEIVAWAFDAKVAFAGVTHDQMMDMVWRSLAYERCLLARVGDEVVGVLGATTKDGHALRLTWRALRDNMSWLKAALGLLFLSIERPLVEGELRIEPLAVSPDMRGRGIGSRLLSRLIADAPGMGITLLSLDVVDTNTGAEKLYLRTGFVRKATQRTCLLTRQAGFSATHYMELSLRANRGEEAQ